MSAQRPDAEPETDIAHAYDQDNNVTQTTDEAGNVLACAFDGLNRKTACTITRAAGFTGTTSQTWQYDGLSRLTQCFDNNDPTPAADDLLVDYFYDSLSRKVEEKQKIGALSAKAVSCSFDIAASGAKSQCSSCTYPDGRVVDCFYDRLDRLVRKRDNGQASDIGAYDYIGKWRVGRLSYQNGVALDHLEGAVDTGFDGLRRVIRHPWKKGTALVVGFGHKETSGNPAYDRANNKLIEEKLHATGDSEAYAYDSVYRLTNFNRGTLDVTKTTIAIPTATPNALQAQAWNLDGVGNWTSNTHTTGGSPLTENRTHSDFNEIGTVSGTPYGNNVNGTHVLDKNGNITDDGRLTYKWDALNRLRETFRKSDGLQVGEYTYDCHNRRFRKIVSNGGVDGSAPNGTTDYYRKGWRVLEEHDAADAITQQYTYGNYLDEVWTLDDRRNGITVANLNDGTGGERKFYHGNTLYGTFGLTDETGTVSEGYQYDAYGRPMIFTGPGTDGQWFTSDDVQATVTAIHNPYLYTGKYFDYETRNQYSNNRYYSPDLGRFVVKSVFSCKS